MDSYNPQVNTVVLAEVPRPRKGGRPKKYTTEEELRQAKDIRRLKNTEAVRRHRNKQRQHSHTAERHLLI